MRHLYVVIDCSRSMEDQDLKPNRLTSTLKVTLDPDAALVNCLLFTFSFCLCLQLIEGFVDEYFDQNPISQVSFHNGPGDSVWRHLGFVWYILNIEIGDL